MKKKHLRRAAEQAQDRLEQAEDRAEAAELNARAQAADLARLKAEVETMRKHWRPVPITHEWQPKNPQCMFCDDPRESARHQVER